MSDAPKLPPDARPLRLVPGYCITDDGRVFRSKDGKAVRSLTLREVKRFAAADIEFDHNRMSRQPLGPLEPEPLVKIDILLEAFVRPDGTVLRQTREIEVTQWVRLPKPAELEALSKGAGYTVSHAWVGGGIHPAVGDTAAGWYRLDDDGAKVLFHGASLAAHERQRV
jgi:hypothetical protein